MFMKLRLTTREAARYGLLTNGKGSLKFDGFLSATFPISICAILNSSKFPFFRLIFINLELAFFSNTQERKPVTNSRDTQELLPDAGQEMLRIFHTHPARTSLLQDFAFYEVRISFRFLKNNEFIMIALAPSHAKDASHWWGGLFAPALASFASTCPEYNRCWQCELQS